MATVLHRVLTLCLALSLLVGVSGPPVACEATPTALGIGAKMTDGCSAAQSSCTDQRPLSCIDHVGCIVLPGMAASPALLPIAFAWTSPSYDRATSILSGISIAPELSPPILAA